MWLLYSALGILIPVGVGLLLVGAVRDASFKVADITDGGQFAIFTCAMLVHTVYLITRPSPRLPLTEWFGLFVVVGLVASSMFFALALLASAGIAIDSIFFRWPSVGLSLVSMLFAFFAVGFDNLRQGVSVQDVQDSYSDSEDELRKRFLEGASTQ